MKHNLRLASLIAGTALATTALAQTSPAQPTADRQSQAQNQAQPGGTITAADFAKRAAIGNMFEIQSSQLASNRTQNDQIRSFAQRMVDDHKKAGDALKTAAQGQTLPEQVDSQHAQMLQTLQGANGPDFDRRYVQQQVTAHEDTVRLFEQYARSGDNAQLKAFASQTLPTLQSHLQAAQGLRQALPPERVGANQQPNQQAQAGENQRSQQQADGSRIVVQQPQPTVRVEQASPQVLVQQPQPNVTVNQPQPQITVRQPRPTVTVDIPQPEIIVRMPQPDVNVAMAQPQVQVRQPQPQVRVVQPDQQPQVQVQRDQAQVQVRQAQGEPQVQVRREEGQPEVRYERAEPRVIVNQPEGQPTVRFERAEGTQDRNQANQQAASQPRQQQARTNDGAAQPLTDEERRVYRERMGVDATETTGAVSEPSGRMQAFGVRQIEDMDVYNTRGERVGSVDRIILGPNNRQYLVIGEGGFLGLGRDRAAFPMERFAARGDRLVIRGVTQDDIENIDDLSSVDGYRRVGANERIEMRLLQ